MPKTKTHRGAAARFKVTGSGRLRRRKQNGRHNLEKKTSTHKRRLHRETELSKADGKRVRRLLGI